jgi:hypothetical protein
LLIKAGLVGLLSSIFLTFIPSPSYATDLQEAVVIALGTADTQVTQSETASTAVAPLVTIATEEANEAIQAASSLSNQITNATSAVNEVDAAIITVTNASGIDQSSLTIIEAKDTVIDAQTAINAISTVIAQSELVQATTARTNVTNAINTAATEFSQANQSISNAQDAINNLQATIATVRDVLQNVDDAGIQMVLPFNMQMGGITYNSIYVGSNATITFGTNEGYVYWDTPSAPSISVGGIDWTTWSYGSGITYATTAGTLDIAWDVRVFPTTDASVQLTQLRFNADVNPDTGAWIATVSGIGPYVDNARWNYREATGGPITPIFDTDTEGANEFQGSLGQGNYTAPTNLPDNSGIQAVVDSANAQLAALNQRISAVVTVNSQNQQLVNTIPSTVSAQTTINNVNTAKINLQSSLNQKSTTLTNTINQYIPTPAPIISQTEVVDGEIVVNVAMPEGYQANTWFYQITTDDPNAENPYEGQTLNTDGSPESFIISGLTEGATYTIRVANWSGPVSGYSSAEILIPSTQQSNLNSGGSIDFNLDGNEQTPPDTTIPDEQDGTETEPTPEDPVDDTPSEEPESPDTDTPESDDSSSNDEQDNSPEENSDTEENDSQDNDTATNEDIQDIVDELLSDGELSSEEKEIIADALIEAANGEPVSAADILAAGLEFRDLPTDTPVEVRTDANGNPVVITAEVASALLTLENPAAFIGGIAACINPDEELEGLTEEQKCEILKALSNIGADMSPQERQKAKEVLVAAILVGQVILGSSILRIRG